MKEKYLYKTINESAKESVNNSMLTKQCGRCHKIIPYGAANCMDCQLIIDESKAENKTKRNRYYDNNARDKRSTAFYNSKAWIMLSKLRMQKDEYKCQVCGAIATEVHHVIPIKKQWNKRYDMDNLMSVCTSCHNRLDR